MVAQVVSSLDSLEQQSKEDIIIKRRGGGSFLESRIVFSSDSKYLYVNCVWGLKVFNVKTGESVQSLFTNCDESIVCIFLIEGRPSAVTSQGTFFSYDENTKKLIRKHKFVIESDATVTNGFLVPRLLNSEVNDLCILCYNGKSEVYLHFYDIENGKRIKHPLDSVMVSDHNSQYNISLGGPEDDKIIASIFSEKLTVHTLNGKIHVDGIFPGKTRKWTCVRTHPSEYSVAVGDNSGRVVLFRNPLKKGSKKPQAVYHWHTLPCRDIAISPAGSLMYTGGGENVLVKWVIEKPDNRNYLPRLSAEIVYIEISNNCDRIAIVTADNNISVIDSQSKFVCVLQELTWGVISVPGTPLFPAGLGFDPRTRTLVLNGSTGKLQFYSPFNETAIFSFDVTNQNYITQERHKVLYNTEVTGACVSSDGAWMSTLETRDDPTARLEQRLKFWEYNFDMKSFVLNTSIECPHNGKAHALKFRPGSKTISVSKTDPLDYLLVTAGNDEKFRIWSPENIESVHKKGVVWGCENTCFYKQKECGPISFSEDGTILGVGFESSLVLWDLTELKVSAVLSTSSNRMPIRFIEFGQFDCFCEIVCATADEVMVWNFMSLSLLWKQPIKTSFLIQDVASSYFAVFTTSNDVYIFKPKSSEPVLNKKNVSDRKGEVLSAIFVPRPKHLSTVPLWMQNSQLFFINSNKELFCFESESESNEVLSVFITPDIYPETAFGSLIAQQQDSFNKSKPSKRTTSSGALGNTSQFLKFPVHAMPSMLHFCGSYLRSLAQSRIRTNVTNNNEKMDVSDEDEIEHEETSSSDDDDDMKNDKTPRANTIEDISNSAYAEGLAKFYEDLDNELGLSKSSRTGEIKTKGSDKLDGQRMDMCELNIVEQGDYNMQSDNDSDDMEVLLGDSNPNDCADSDDSMP